MSVSFKRMLSTNIQDHIRGIRALSLSLCHYQETSMSHQNLYVPNSKWFFVLIHLYLLQSFF